MNFLEKIKNKIMRWLNIEKAENKIINIQEALGEQDNFIKNQIWLRGQAYEIEQLFKTLKPIDFKCFWGSTTKERIIKKHTGLPGLIVNVLSNISIRDLNGIKINDNNYQKIWDDIIRDNDFYNKLQNRLKIVLAMGEGCFKISFKPNISKFPIISFVKPTDYDIVYENDRYKETIFKNTYKINNKEYVLLSTYGYGYIHYNLYDKSGKEVELSLINETSNLKDLIFDNTINLAIPFRIWESDMFENRGKSIFDGKDQAFDSLDECLSQWMDALRKSRTKQYIPKDFIPKDTNGNLMKLTDDMNEFILIDSPRVSSEGNFQKIEVVQPTLPHSGYLETYMTLLDLSLQGILSPSTLGIDVKKLDNAESQREKEKMTLYTLNSINKSLDKFLQNLVYTTLKAYDLQLERNTPELEISVEFGEYANPSFEAVVETMTKAAPGKQVLSFEKIVDELYGDTITDEEKKEEVEKLKELNGLNENIYEENFYEKQIYEEEDKDEEVIIEEE